MRNLNLTLSLGGLILSSTCLAQQPNWVQIKTQTSPPARVQHAMSYDPATGRTVLFGGLPASKDTWEYDGKNWTLIKTTTAPSTRHLCQMVGTPRGSLLFGGSGLGCTSCHFLAETWLWDSIKKTWTQMRPKNSPSARYNAALAYDSARNRVVLFGGYSGVPLNDTWEWDGVNWNRITTKNAPSPRQTNMVYDAARKRMVLFGGQVGNSAAVVNDTWEYDGKDWKLMKPTTQPSARCCVGLAYDTARQRTVMHSGWSGYFQDTWEYDGKTWTRVTTAIAPSARYDFDYMVYDQRRGRMVLFGGRQNINVLLNDTWEYVAPRSLDGSPFTISIATGGTQTLSLNAGTAQASRLYQVFGSVTGTSPGVTLASAAGSVTLPLNPDFWTDITIGLANTPPLTRTRGTLDGSGKATATFNVPKITNSSAIGARFHHAYLVYDARNNFYMASNAVELVLVK